jgi:hypothetical protein
VPGRNEIVYKDGKRMYVVPVRFSPTFEKKGDAQLLFEGAYPNIPGFDYAISSDGEKFLMLENRAFFKPTTTLTVITNFFDELNRRFLPAQK